MSKVPKKKSAWMKWFVIGKPLTPLELSQIESRKKIVNDFKKLKRR